MFKRIIGLCILFGVSAGATAGTIDIVLDPTSFGDSVTGPAPLADPSENFEISSISHAGGLINLHDWEATDTVTVDHDADWWHESGPVYSTTSHGIEISFSNLSVVGFTFRVAANEAARAYVQAFSGGSLVDDTGWFGGFGQLNSRSVGVYAAAGSGTCIDRIVVDPAFTWGIGDFTVATDAGCNAEAVPIPPAIALFLAGLAGLGAWSKRRPALAG